MSAPVEVTADLLAEWLLPFPVGEADKEIRGRVMVVGGSTEVPGAVRLAGEGALRAGAGKLQIAAPAELALSLGLALPEARVFALPSQDGEIAPEGATLAAKAACRCDAVVVGPGMIDERLAGEAARAMLRQPDIPAVVIDAGAMARLRYVAAEARSHAGRLVITPHAGEMANLLSAEKRSVQADPLAAAREVAAELQAVVALKGRTTMVVSPDGSAWRHSLGAQGLGTSGSGDVLAGVIGGLLARGASPVQATVWGVFLHGQAGARLAERMGPLGFLAREIAGEIPSALAVFQPGRDEPPAGLSG